MWDIYEILDLSTLKTNHLEFTRELEGRGSYDFTIDIVETKVLQFDGQVFCIGLNGAETIEKDNKGAFEEDDKIFVGFYTDES